MFGFVDLNVSKYISLRTKPSSICKVKLHLRIAKLNFDNLEKAFFQNTTYPIGPTKYMDFSMAICIP